MKTRTERSAGGVCYRSSGAGPEIALIKTHEGRWQLPKGWIEDGEAPEAAALREVREEAGLEAEIVAPLDTIEYWYVSRYDPEPARVHKFVQFFLARCTGGSTDDHDDEVTEARWLPIEDAARTLSHEDERRIVAAARALLRERDSATAEGFV